MLTLYLFYLQYTSGLDEELCECKNLISNNTRINGNEVRRGELPYVASLFIIFQNKNGSYIYRHFCTGTGKLNLLSSVFF